MSVIGQNKLVGDYDLLENDNQMNYNGKIHEFKTTLLKQLFSNI